MTSAKIKLHKAGMLEVPLLTAIQNRCFPMTPWQESTLWETMAVPGSMAWLATWEEQPAGYAIMRLIADEAEILSLGVLTDRRCRGIGESLLSRALGEAKRMRAAAIFLEVGESNLAARRLYEKAGFTLDYRRLHYYGIGNDTEDALVLKLKMA